MLLVLVYILNFHTLQSCIHLLQAAAAASATRSWTPIYNNNTLLVNTNKVFDNLAHSCSLYRVLHFCPNRCRCHSCRHHHHCHCCCPCLYLFWFGSYGGSVVQVASCGTSWKQREINKIKKEGKKNDEKLGHVSFSQTDNLNCTTRRFLNWSKFLHRAFACNLSNFFFYIYSMSHRVNQGRRGWMV